MQGNKKPQLVAGDNSRKIGWVDPDPFKNPKDLDEFKKLVKREKASERTRKGSDR